MAESEDEYTYDEYDSSSGQRQGQVPAGGGQGLTAELEGHVDGTLKDLACNKMLSVLNEKAKGFEISSF